MSQPKKIQTLPFFAEWKGHPLPDLAALHSHIISASPSQPIVYLAGDSSLDNKAWVPSSSPTLNGSALPVPTPSLYTSTLDDSNHIKPDVAFWLNHILSTSSPGPGATCLNTAVEASLLRERDTALLPHDAFIRDHLRAQDILIVSVGANDIALSPTAATALHMLLLAWLTPAFVLRRGWAPSLLYFRRLFRDRVQAYVERMVEKTRPRAVLVCMIYFPLETGVMGRAGAKEAKGPWEKLTQWSRSRSGREKAWADLPLAVLGYNFMPGRLQAAIRSMYEMATREVKVEGTQVIPVPLFEVLDGKREEEYVARVEPSIDGGRKLAEFLEGVMRPLLVGSS